ncbi:MAG TPA: DUF1326 domain-containing protein [Candidatus Binataceae bacterium]|jgi:hypothetical protein|nr:DUF1326 domain-containing protein [Candidatus Binataceae bacterium]
MKKIEWLMKGRYLKNCNCIASCTCDTVGIPSPQKGCEGVAGMRIDRGHFGAVPLEGLSWVTVARWPGGVHEGHGEAQAFIDERATGEQRTALLTILSGQAGNAWFEFLASTFSTVHPPQFVPIEFEFDKSARKARVVIPGAVETVSTPLILPNTGQEHRVTVHLPDGREYFEMEVAQAAVLRGSGAIRFEHRNTHSSLAEVTYSHDR